MKRPSMAEAAQNIWVYIGGLFVLSRLFYVALGSVVHKMMDPFMPASMSVYAAQISKHAAIQMWYVWDSMHYANLAQMYNFSLSQLSPMATVNGKGAYYLLHWFPLYSVLAKVLHEVTHISIPYCLLLISNAAFIGSLYLIYKLVRFDGGSESFARKVVALLVLQPTSFLFSAALSESLFLFLALLAMYFARREKWILAGCAGFFLALTHSQGFLIFIPLIIEAYQQYGLKPKQAKDKLRPYIKPLLACALAVMGLVAFMVYSYLRTKNLLAYVDSQHIGNGVHLNDPFTYVLKNLLKLRTLLVLGELLLVALAWKKLRWSYLAYTAIFTLAALAIGNSAVASILRYQSVIFPVAIAAGYLTERKITANFVWIALGIVNGALFILWAVWWTGFII